MTPQGTIDFYFRLSTLLSFVLLADFKFLDFAEVTFDYGASLVPLLVDLLLVFFGFRFISNLYSFITWRMTLMTFHPACFLYPTR